MEIKILELIDGAKEAEGLTVIIDVFRAFSLEAYLFSRGASRILAVGKEQTARLIKMHHDEYVLIGERGGKILPGFDYGNSPAQTKNVDFTGKTVIHTTSSGTQGIVNASKATEILTGSLVNAQAVVNYIKRQNPSKVSLVAMGLSGKSMNPEDILCARYMKSLLDGTKIDMESEMQKVKDHPLTAKFFNPEFRDIFPEEDFHMCMKVDQFDFVLKVSRLEKDVFQVDRIDL